MLESELKQDVLCLDPDEDEEDEFDDDEYEDEFDDDDEFEDEFDDDEDEDF